MCKQTISFFPPIPDTGSWEGSFLRRNFVNNDVVMNEAWEHWSINALANTSRPLFEHNLTIAVAKIGWLITCQELADNVFVSVLATFLWTPIILLK